MRVVLDTNILVSVLLVEGGGPGRIYQSWTNGDFTLLMSKVLMSELRSTLRKPYIAARVRPSKVGGMLNQLKRMAEPVDPLPRVVRSSDPEDDFLLAMAEAGGADYLVTGDKNGLLSLVRHQGTRIVTAKEFVGRLL